MLLGDSRNREGLENRLEANVVQVIIINNHGGMADGGHFLHRVMSYLVNELLVDSLANSRSFHGFALRTSKQMDELSNLVAKKKEQLAEQMKDISSLVVITPSVYILLSLRAIERK